MPCIARHKAWISYLQCYDCYYQSIITAADVTRLLPMLITAAETIAPAKVFVIGAVAGLQACATAKRQAP